MSRLEEIQAAIAELPSDDYDRLTRWFNDHEHARWEEQIDRDAAAGKLDFLIEEAEREFKQGNLRPWPPNV